MIAKRAPGPPAGLQVLRARAFRRVPLNFKYLPWLQGGSAGPSSPYGRRPTSGAGGIRGPGTLWSTAHCCIMSEDTFGMHEKQLGVELMRELCDPRGDCAWCPKWGGRESITCTGDAARPSNPLEPSLVDVFDHIFVNASALVGPTTADRAGEASGAV